MKGELTSWIPVEVSCLAAFPIAPSAISDCICASRTSSYSSWIDPASERNRFLCGRRCGFGVLISSHRKGSGVSKMVRHRLLMESTLARRCRLPQRGGVRSTYFGNSRRRCRASQLCSETERRSTIPNVFPHSARAPVGMWRMVGLCNPKMSRTEGLVVGSSVVRGHWGRAVSVGSSVRCEAGQ